MGEVIDSKKVSDDKLIYKIIMNESEVKHLMGNMKNVHLFSSNLCNIETIVQQKGNHNGTKYFIIPNKIKKKYKMKSSKISYQRIDDKGKLLFVYTVPHSK